MDLSGSLKGVVLTESRRVHDFTGWDLHAGLLLPMANVPMIERILESYAHAGIRETLISAGTETQEIASLCGNGERWNMALTYLDHSEESSSIALNKEVADFVGDAPYLATQGPVLLDAEAYLHAAKSLTKCGPAGIRVWQSAEGRSGAGDVPGCVGVYLLTPAVYEDIDEHGEPEARDCTFAAALDQLASHNDTVMNMALEKQPYSVQTPESYLDSNVRLLETVGLETTTPEIISDNFSSPNLVLRPPVLVDADAELERCRIGPGVCVGPGVHIGHGAAIEHSVIMAGADIGDGASISHAVIGTNAGIENRAVIHGSGRTG